MFGVAKRNMNRYSATLVLVLAAFVVFQVQSNGTATANHAATQVQACGALAYSGVYQLASNLEHDGAGSLSCITIGADDVTFSNPHGFSIKGAGGADGRVTTGISINAKSGVVVEGQIVSNFANGIFLGGDVTGTVVRGNTAQDNLRWGIRAQDAQSGLIYNNIVSGNQEQGIWLASSNNFDVNFNKVFGNKGFSGVNFQGSSGNMVTNNTVNSNWGFGILLSGDNNVVTDNETRFNAASGIAVHSGDNVLNFNRSESNGSAEPSIQNGFLSNDESIDSTFGGGLY